MLVSTGRVQRCTSTTQTEMNIKDIHFMEDNIKTSIQVIVQLKTDIDVFLCVRNRSKIAQERPDFILDSQIMYCFL